MLMPETGTARKLFSQTSYNKTYITTGSYSASSYLYADSSADKDVWRHICGNDESGNPIYLSDLSGNGHNYGDYVYALDVNGNAVILDCLLDKIDSDYTVPAYLGGHKVVAVNERAYLNVKITDGANITIPNGVTSIGKEVFLFRAEGVYTKNIGTVLLPASLTTMGTDVFTGAAVAEIHILTAEDATKPITATNLFGSTRYTNVTVTVSKKAYDTLYTGDWGKIAHSCFTTVENQYQDEESGVVYYVESCADGYKISYVVGVPEGTTVLELPETYNGLPVVAITGSAFAGIPDSVTTIILPSGLRSFSPNPADLPASLTAYVIDASNPTFTVADGVLYGKDDEGSVTVLISVPRGLTGDYTVPATVTTVSAGAFYGSALTAVTLPAHRVILADNVFVNCPNLTTITVPAGGAFDALGAFRDLPNLAVIDLSATSEISRFFGSAALEDVNSAAKILIPAGTTDAYRSGVYGDAGVIVFFEEAAG